MIPRDKEWLTRMIEAILDPVRINHGYRPDESGDPTTCFACGGTAFTSCGPLPDAVFCVGCYDVITPALWRCLGGKRYSDCGDAFDAWRNEWLDGHAPDDLSWFHTIVRSAFNGGVASADFNRTMLAERIVQKFFGGQPNDSSMRAEFDLGLGRRTCSPSELTAIIQSVIDDERSSAS